ncbi:amidohydrolase family protein [Flavobacterium terrigena]|uniref:Amidohydrolase n=1 Tax=Flavobacterium terrigena TaxID=402734 RepID=A0A1H6S551_9FLAO|nr:amidohydrolase family protein [Flavobacterium terrigena]SEI63278.1 Amidohydrolase [Flavobacterium terrigena]
MEKHKIFNTHTHIFTIDHVPNKFGKRLMPLGLHHVITMRFVKWYYKNFTSRGNHKFKVFKNRLNSLKYTIKDFFRKTIILHLLLSIIFFFINWFFKIIIYFFRVEVIFSKSTRETVNRFLTLGRYSLYQDQSKIFDLLSKSYDTDTRFVVLSMDMDYMEAGQPTRPYLQQLEELRCLKIRKKERLLPFLFLDPRRIAATKHAPKQKNYENYAKHLLQSQQFDGIKLYPALGYYPFDKNLIEMYLFAQENEIPIITHCIAGTVFYRGKKQQEWNQHPVLKYHKKEGVYESIPLPQREGYQYSTNFTHPLNYHCLLNKELLNEFLGNSPDKAIDLSKLKICLAHFGGEDEWKKYLNDCWNNYNKNISHDSKTDYSKRKNTLNHGNPRTIWWDASWLSVIYDLMIEYENVYADISFILHDESLFPLLKFILEDDKVKNKVLFGSDYYVVSQKDTEKDLHLNLRGYLGDTLFQLIANENPRKFLTTKFNQY